MMTRLLLSQPLWLLLLAVCVPAAAWSQVDNGGADEAKTVFTHRWEMGLTLHTRGMGGHIERGAYRGVGKVSTWSLEVVSMKHPKRSAVSTLSMSRPRATFSARSIRRTWCGWVGESEPLPRRS